MGEQAILAIFSTMRQHNVTPILLLAKWPFSDILTALKYWKPKTLWRIS